MIVLTVKTLDSQNHTFTVDDDITVEQFKAKIADTVNIPAETQRIIYCGRVLQDNAKLNDYDVNGKVVHLVQRAPPSQNPPSSNRSDSPHPQSRRVRINPLDQTGNSMYLGSMAFQSNLLDSQNIMPPPPTHSLAASRLNVARRMLRRAELVINTLENPSAPPPEQNPEENQEEEVTPIIEARVIVPSAMNDAIDEAAVLSAVHSSLFNATGAIATEVRIENVNDNSTSTTADNSTPATTSTSAATEEAIQAENIEAARRALSENASRTEEMEAALAHLNRVQARFAPFLERYRQFMADDPQLEDDNLRPSQQLLSRVSEVMHFLGHAYHSLSDIIVRARTPPPRPLLCRPILIQHSAVVQAGIPIEVAFERVDANSERSGDSNQNANAAADAPSTREQNGYSRRHTVTSTPSTTTSSTIPSAAATNTPATPNTTSTPSSSSTSASSSTAASGQAPEGNAHVPGNSSFELFMEVTPEGNLANLANGPTPEFIQSLMQMAGRFIMNRVDQPNQQQSETGQTQSASSSQRREPVIIPNLTIIRSTATQESNAATQSGTTGQNSQARGNTQTNPTTATYTRSTPRPHVQIAPPASVQGLFDPFLMCNSHHVGMRRRQMVHRGQRAARQREQQQQQQPQQQQQQQPSQQQQPQQQSQSELQQGAQQGAQQQRAQQQGAQQGAQQQGAQQRGAQTHTFQHIGPMNLQNLMNTIFGGLRHAHQHHHQQPQQRPSFVSNGTQTGSAAEGSQSTIPPPLGGPTIADILRELPDENAMRPGESILNDLIMLFSDIPDFREMMVITAGNLRPLDRVRNDVQQFFLTRILDGSTTPQSMEIGINRILNEIKPFIEYFKQFPTRSNIDMAQSIESVFRQRLPDIINIAVNLNSNNNMGDFVQQCVRIAKLICALSLHASANGEAAVESTFEEMIRSYMSGTPVDMSNWTVMNSRVNLRNFISSIDIPENEITPYIVYKTESMPEENAENATEPMECEETEQNETAETNEASAPPIDEEPLPNVVIGSEQWHAGVPEDWVPIITRDVQRQRRQSPQSPFSDAYLQGMPSKRRKIINGSKPQGSLPQVITDSVRRAVTATGLTNVAPLEVVAQAAGNSTEVQTAYRNLLRSTVQANLRNNEDFTPERFPNAATYFKSPQ